ncbi:glycoside hydrolase family 31 protein [Marivirga arenosa]|uniref:Glycoside hydrolase family 31 protein n=1 Tax=Marivirga arenosa TaxID=3059076 RepID=A0AA52F1L6_9BACT|nr:glycoside hydrolase family 31 protein [Marivirga sp. BKB1-2]WNB18849.1 glycoside hydrolase family 31 protein [Marivirga sp. BKB1-2]
MISSKTINKSNSNLHCGNIEHYEETSYGISGKTENAYFKITVIQEGTFKIHLSTSEEFDELSYAVISKPLNIDFSCIDHDNIVEIKTDKLTLELNKSPFAVKFKNKSGELINEDDASFSTSWLGEQVTTYKKLQEGERFIGLGEKTGPLDRKGNGYQNWNTDHFGYPPDSDPLYCSIPFYIGIHNHLSYGIYLDNSHKSHFNFGASNRRFSSFSADQGDMSYYFIYEDNVEDIISAYTDLTGRMELPPIWSLGYQQCRYSYKPDKEVLGIANFFREKEIPADVMVLDIHHMQDYKIFTWDGEDFPNPSKMIEKLEEMGFKLVVICDPGIKIQEGYEAYDSGVKEDVFIKYPDGEYYEGEVWPGWCHFPDFTNPDVRNWWAEKLKAYTDLGISGLWNDMNEIATWGQYLPELMEFDFEGQKASTRKARNIYGMQMARSTYEGAKKNHPNKRVFNLTRAGFAGIQRYASVWTGDNVANDEHMLLGVRLVNSLGLTGVAFSGYDIGGFAGDANSKLFARWISIGAFAPFFRGHSMINSRDSEPWAFGEEVEEISRNYINLRYKLMPYIYSAFYEAHESGIPVARSLAIYYPHDDKIYNSLYENQYLFGANILVAPVSSEVNLAKVYLPEGEWYDLYDDKFYHGKQEIIAECPIEKLPAFVKASSIIPMQDRVQSLSNNQNSVLYLHIYKGLENNTYQYYEDDGDTFNHVEGAFYKRLIEYKPQEKQIIFHAREGNYKSQYKEVQIYFHGFENELKQEISIDQQSIPIEKSPYRFIDPISNFDPLPDEERTDFKIENLPLSKFKWEEEQFIINW